MAKEKKQFRQLSDQELEKVTGGVKIERPGSGSAKCVTVNVDLCPNGTTIDKFGCPKCI